jgi:hypothetical protein
VNKQFLLFLAIGLAVVGGGIALLLMGTKGNHLEVVGDILKVRVLTLSPAASLVIVDFRVRDTSDVPWVMKSATLTLEPASGAILDGTTVSKADIETVFQYNKILGPKFNDVLGIKDRIEPRQKLDRMVAARFEIPESQAEDRKAIHLHLEEMDGATADLIEKKQ